MVLLGNIIKRYPKEYLHEDLQHTPEIRSLLENIYKETKADLLKLVTEIYQQLLMQHINFHKIIFNSVCILFFN